MSAPLSAADLQRRHDLEGKPDPFSFSNAASESRSSSSRKANGLVDVESDIAFPSLNPGAAAKPAGAWSNAPRLASTVPAAKQTGSQTLTLPSIDLNQVAKGGKPPTLLEYQKTVGSKFRVQVSSTQQRASGQTTFTIKSESDKDIIKAKKHLIATLSPVVTLKVEAPNSTLPSIIGPGGSTIKNIRDKTNARIDVPRREAEAEATTPPGEDVDEPTTTISISAPQPLALEAKAMVEEIIRTKQSKLTQRIRDIPTHIIPFLTLRKAEILQKANAEGDVALTLDRNANTITIAGDREAVKIAAKSFQDAIEQLRNTLTSVKLSLPKKQHRLLTPAVANEILAKTRCSVGVPPIDDPTEEITVWGAINSGTDISAALGTVITTINSQHTQEFTLPANIAKIAVIHIIRTGYIRTLQASLPKVTVHLPTNAQLARPGALSIDLIGEKASVEAAVKELSTLSVALLTGSRKVDVDHLRHRAIQTKGAKKLKQLHESEKTHIHFPDEKEESSSIFLVVDPSVADGDRAAHLQKVEDELVALSKEAGELKEAVLPIEAQWHDSILGKDGTTLNAIIGTNGTLFIKVGSEAQKLAKSQSADVVYIRGAVADVDRVSGEIKQIVERAQTDGIENEFTTEFEVSRDYIGRVVGTGGAGVNKLRDQLGVKIDLVDETDDKEKDAKKKKSSTPSAQKVAVKISGRRENAEEAKRRILALVDRLADEASEVLKIPHQFHASLIGPSGKYVIRLEDKYVVKITFPREGHDGDNKGRESLKADEVLVKGGKKGVAGAKSELLEALEFEKESNNTISFNVPTKTVSRILGKGGATINDIKDDAGVQIDIDKSGNDQTKVSLRGTKKGIAEAKAKILEIVEQIGDEVSETLIVENRFHRSIIGQGGQTLRDLIQRCGGPSESRLQANLVHFPRAGEKPDEVSLRGDRTVVKKVKAELEKLVAGLKDRVVLAVAIPAAQHKALIGRGGQHLTDLQNKHGVQVQFPGSRSYGSVGAAENESDLGDVEVTDLVKVQGPKDACAKAIEELKSKIKAPSVSRAPSTNSTACQTIVNVPNKYHQALLRYGDLPRKLRSLGVTLDTPSTPSKPASPKLPSAGNEARIDDDQEAGASAEWHVTENYQGYNDDTSEWILKGADDATLDKGKAAVDEALKAAKEASHVGTLTLPNKNAFPRIVGTKGSNVARLRAETKTDITVSRDDNTIVITGSKDALEAAKAAILQIVNAPPARGRNEY